MTSKQITFNALDSYFLNTSNNKLNVSYLNNCIYDIFDIEYRHNRAFNSNKSILQDIASKKTITDKYINARVWEAFIHFTNQAIENEYGEGYSCTSAQLKQYLSNYGYSYEALEEVKQAVKKLFQDMKK